MEVNTLIFLLSPVTLYGHKIPNSVQIIPAKVIETLSNGMVTVEIAMENGKTNFKEVNEKEVYKTMPLAIQGIEPFLNNKVKYIDEKDYIGEELPQLQQV